MYNKKMVDLSVVIPIFNEEETIPKLYTRLKKVLKDLSLTYEIIFIDDGSKDQSFIRLKELRDKNNQIKLISFSRNFGHMSAVSAGLKHSSGNKVVLIDGDLQDPPEIIPEMLKKAKDFEVVYGIKKKRKEGFLRRLLFKSFYLLLNTISPYKMPKDAGTFSVIDKKVVNILNSLPERNKYLSGLRAWIGFAQTGIIYERDARFAGKPASLTRLFKLALDGMISFSYIPLRLSSFLGFTFASLAFVFIIIVVILRVFFEWGIVGWASTLSTVLLIGGVQLITLGIIGEYLARIYDEVKQRPEYIITQKIGF